MLCMRAVNCVGGLIGSPTISVWRCQNTKEPNGFSSFHLYSSIGLRGYFAQARGPTTSMVWR